MPLTGCHILRKSSNYDDLRRVNFKVICRLQSFSYGIFGSIPLWLCSAPNLAMLTTLCQSCSLRLSDLSLSAICKVTASKFTAKIHHISHKIFWYEAGLRHIACCSRGQLPPLPPPKYLVLSVLLQLLFTEDMEWNLCYIKASAAVDIFRSRLNFTGQLATN